MKCRQDAHCMKGTEGGPIVNKENIIHTEGNTQYVTYLK